MLRRVLVTDCHHKYFTACWEVYTESFPYEERRGKEYQEESMKFEKFHFEAILNDDEFIGIIGWWEFENFRYIEHLATISTLRGGGYGKKALSEFIAESTKPIILEVEHPTSQINQRRIGFYQRIGFTLNEYPYAHPPYHTNQEEFVSLMIMSYPSAITPKEYEAFKDECFSLVHFRYDTTK